MVLVHPAGDAEIVRVELELAAAPRVEAATGAGQEHDHRAAEHLADVPDRDRQQRLHAARAGQLAAHRVERRRPSLALAGRVGLRADARGEAAGDEPDHQHDREEKEVTNIADRERVDRRDEQEVEGGDAQHRRQQRRALTVVRRDHHDPQQIDHHQVRQLEERQRQPRDPAGQRDDRRRPDVGRPFRRDRAASDRRDRRRILALAADDLDVDVAAAPDQRVDDRAEQHALPQRAPRLAHDDLGHVAIVRERQDRLAHRPPAQGHRLRAQLLGQAPRLHDPVLVFLRHAQLGRRLDVGGDPRGVEPVGHALGRADEPGRERARVHAHQQALGDGPDLLDRVLAPVDAHLRVHAVGGPAKGELTERDQVALPEEILDRLLRLVRHVDLALAEAFQEIVGRQVDQLDVVGLLEHRVGHRLADHDAGDLGDDVVEALDVLDVHRGVHVDAGVEELEHVLPSLGVAGPRRVGVGELVHQDQGGAARQRAVQIELAQARSAILHAPRRQRLEPGQQRVGLGALVRLDVADDHVAAVGALVAPGLEHRVRLADAGGGAEEDLQLAAPLARLFFFDAGQERFRVGSVRGHGLSVAPTPPAAATARLGSM